METAGHKKKKGGKDEEVFLDSFDTFDFDVCFYRLHFIKLTIGAFSDCPDGGSSNPI